MRYSRRFHRCYRLFFMCFAVVCRWKIVVPTIIIILSLTLCRVRWNFSMCRSFFQLFRALRCQVEYHFLFRCCCCCCCLLSPQFMVNSNWTKSTYSACDITKKKPVAQCRAFKHARAYKYVYNIITVVFCYTCKLLLCLIHVSISMPPYQFYCTLVDTTASLSFLFFVACSHFNNRYLCLI